MSTTGVLVKNGRLIDPRSNVDAMRDVLLSGGRVLDVAASLTARSERVVDAKGAWVVPGLIDLHSVLRDTAELREALRGGFTTVLGAPESSLRESDLLTVLHAAPLTRDLAGVELGEVAAGTVALSQGFSPIGRAGVLRSALQYLAPLDVLAIVHAEDASLSSSGVLGESETATRLGLAAVPSSAETSIVARDLELASETGGRLHFAHLSCARSVELVRAAKARGVRVSCDVTPHHLTLSTEAAEGYSKNARRWPPLRSRADVEALRAGVRDGTIDAIACDHVRVDPLDQEHPFEQCAPGGPAFVEAVRVALDLDLPPARVVELLSVNPAALLRLPTARLSKESVADVTVIDPSTRSVRATIVAGQVRYLAEER